MKEQSVSIANLDEKQLARLTEIEKEMGVILVAFDKITNLADLSEEDLKNVQKLEKTLGVTLLAYK